jgi:hypothetical protein
MPEDRPTGGRLTVRKDAHRELEFRYSREERLGRGTAPLRSVPTGSFLKSRSFRILLLNVGLLAGIAFAGARLLTASGDRVRIGPFAASLQAMVYESTVYVTVTLRYAGRAGSQPPAERFTARFVLEPGGEEVQKSGALPRSPGEEVTVGQALPLAESSRVRAELELGSWKRTLTRTLGR